MTLDSLSQRESLDDADVSELDFDDEPTAVDTRAARLRRDSIFPPSSRGEVFSLIEQRTRPSLELVDESPIDFGDVLRSPAILPGWDSLPETDPAGHAPHQMSSIAPVALPTAPPPPKSREVPAAPLAGKRYLAAMGALATIAAALALWTPANGSAPPSNAAAAAVAFERPTPVVAVEEAAPRPLDLAEIRILGREEATPLASTPTGPSEPSFANAPAVEPPASEPAAVEPSAAGDTNAVGAAAADTMPPVEPPAPKAPTFDRGAASTAMSSGASQATACREPGLPSAQARVSVTFAPSGRVAAVNVDGAYAGTNTGSCIGKTFRNLRVEPFDGAAVTVHKTFRF